jgi:predicted tellurium resistance membrane protein TerC
VTVPIWAWIAFAAFVVTMLAVDLFVLHRRACEVSLKLERRLGRDRPRLRRAAVGLARRRPRPGLRGQRFLVRDRGRVLATSLLLALIVVETTDVIFAVDSIPAILAVSSATCSPDWPASRRRC